MADTEVDTAVPAPVAAEAQNGARNDELPPYDDSLLIKVKGKVKRPQRPDDSERNIIIGKLQGEVNKNSDRMKEIKEILDNRQRSGRVVPPEQQEIRKRLDASKQEFQSVLRQKQHIREELNSAIQERTALRDEIRSLREKTPRGVNLGELEAKLQEAEFKLSHESLSEAEEKRLTQALTNMNAAKPMARQHAMAEAKLKEVEDAKNEASKRLTECDSVLNAIRAREDVDRAALAKMQEDNKANDTVDFPALVVEKQECWQVITALRDKMTEIRKDFDVKYKEYIKLDKNYNNWLRHDRRAKWEERQKARADREQEDGGAGGEGVENVREHIVAEPYESEILTIDQLVTYLKSFSATKEAEKTVEVKEVEIPTGMKLMKKKDDEDFMPVAKKAPKGQKNQKQVVATPKAPVDPSKKKLSHTLELLQTFMQLGIDVPNTEGDIPATIEKAEAKKAEFLEKRRKKKEAPAKKEAGEPSSSNAAASNGTHTEEAKEEEPEEEEEEEEPEETKEEEEAPAPAAAPAKEEEKNVASAPVAEAAKPTGDGIGVALNVGESGDVTLGITSA